MWLLLERRLLPDPRVRRVLHIAPDAHLATMLKSRPGIAMVFGALHPDDFEDFGAVRADVGRLPFPEGAFDLVLCNHVLQEVPDEEAALREIHRVLRPGGTAVLQVPVALGLAATRTAKDGMTRRQRRRSLGSTAYVRLYGKDYPGRISRAGFDVEQTHPVRDGWAPDAAQWAVDPRETLVLAHKPPSRTTT